MTFEEITKDIDKGLDEKKCSVLYAFNAVGKTRISKAICDLHQTDNEEDNKKVICYNAFLEDDFTWDNEQCIFKIQDSWITKLIQDEGLDSEIIDTFKTTIGKNIEPKFDLKNGSIEFFDLGRDFPHEHIKISKGEETLFKWALFYTILNEAEEMLEESIAGRSSHIFDKLKYIIIDDPVSSIDDYRIYTVATQILELVKKIGVFNGKHIEEQKIHVSFLLTTHHVLFFNILANGLRKKGKKCILNKDGEDYVLTEINDGPGPSFVYHLAVLREIKKAVEENNIQKKHFNLLRSVLEKTSIFFGFSAWDELFSGFGGREPLKRMLNSNSHERFIELQTPNCPAEQIQLFKEGLDWFIKQYHINENALRS